MTCTKCKRMEGAICFACADRMVSDERGSSLASTVLLDVIHTMRHARVFITSREKMNPTGVQLWDELLAKLERHADTSNAESEAPNERSE